MKALTIAGVELRRLSRWRANVFFLFVLPMLIILLLGAAFGESSARIGIVAEDVGALGEALVAELEGNPDLELERFEDTDDLEGAVQRGRVSAGVVVPAVYDQTLRRGGEVDIRYFARPDTLAQELRPAVDAAVAEQSGLLRAARLLESEGLASLDEGLARAAAAAEALPPVAVRVTTADGSAYPTPAGRFEEGASTQLLLFVFFTSLNGAIWLIEGRRLGVLRRILATPTPVRTLLAGEALGRFGIAVVQAAIIVLGSALAFGVRWGDPLGATALVLVFCLVGTGAALLLGSVASSEQQASPVALLLGLGLAAFGGSMVPIEVFPDAVRTVAHVTPHAWGNDAFTQLLRHDGGLDDIALELGVLAGMATALLAIATWRLRAAITRG